MGDFFCSCVDRCCAIFSTVRTPSPTNYVDVQTLVFQVEEGTLSTRRGVVTTWQALPFCGYPVSSSAHPVDVPQPAWPRRPYCAVRCGKSRSGHWHAWCRGLRGTPVRSPLQSAGSQFAATAWFALALPMESLFLELDVTGAGNEMVASGRVGW